METVGAHAAKEGILYSGTRRFSHTSGVNKHNYFSESTKGDRSIVVNYQVYIYSSRMEARLLKGEHMHLEKETL